MNAASSLARRRPLVTFFVLAYALSWWPFPLYVADVWPIPFFAFGPLLAALIVIPLSEGGAGLRALGAGCFAGASAGAGTRSPWACLRRSRGRRGARRRTRRPSPVARRAGPLVRLILVFAVRLVNPLDGPMGEEPGWRGHAQPRLQAARSPLVATVVLGLLVAGWHLPLLAVDLIPLDIPTTFAVTFMYAWIFNHTGGSAFMTLVAHAAQGIVQAAALWPEGVDATRVVWLEDALLILVAIGLVVFDREAWRAPSEQAEPPTAGRPAIPEGGPARGRR